MSLADNDYGHIYMQFGDTDPEKVANSFTEFLEGLEYDEQTIIISKSIFDHSFFTVTRIQPRKQLHKLRLNVIN